MASLSALFLNFSDNYMRIRLKANTTDRRMVGFKFVSLLKTGVDLTHRRHLDFAAPSPNRHIVVLLFLTPPFVFIIIPKNLCCSLILKEEI
jgi:hypothetical protein